MDQGLPDDTFSHEPPRRRFGCLGSLLVALAALFLICGGLCGGGYYAIFHSSMPLTKLEELLESDGSMEIEGLSGSISSGFHIDRLRVRDAEGQWSTMSEIDFEFNGVQDLFSEQRLIIDRLTVGSGEIYYGDFDDDAIAGRPPETGPAQGDDPDANAAQPTGNEDEILREVRIDLIEFSDLKFLNADGVVQSELGRVAIKDFHYVDGDIQNMGALEIKGLVARGDTCEIENLSGSTDSGFAMDRLRFRADDGGEWSELKGMDFQFNGVNDLMENQRLVIDRWSIESGRVLCDWHEGEEIDPDEADESGDPDADWTGDQQSKLKEVRIGLIHLPNLTLVNSATGVEFKIDEIAMEDLQVTDGTVTQLGNVTVTADQIEFRTALSSRFPGRPESVVARNFSGVVRSTIHQRVRADIPFDIDVCFAGKEQTLVNATLFDGKLVSVANENGEHEVTFTDFTFTDYVDWRHGPLPSHVTAEIRATHDPEHPQQETYSIAPEATFQLGRRTFRVETGEIIVDGKSNAAPPIVAVHDSESGRIHCRLHALEDEPHWAIELTPEDGVPTRDVYADVLFGKDFESLDDGQKEQIGTMLKTVQAIGLDHSPLSAEEPGKRSEE